MPYADKIKALVAQAPVGLSGQLGRTAVRLDFSVPRIAMATGATRQTVYNWFKGGTIAPAYRERVQQLIDIMYTSDTAEIAWRKACHAFNLRA